MCSIYIRILCTVRLKVNVIKYVKQHSSTAAETQFHPPPSKKMICEGKRQDKEEKKEEEEEEKKEKEEVEEEEKEEEEENKNNKNNKMKVEENIYRS